MKKGRISKGEEQFIEEHLHSMTHAQIAETLDRDPASIELFIKRKFRLGLTEEEDAAFTLEDRPYWAELKEQFTEGELELFKYHWSRIISQFKDNVIPTEELQVIDLIKLELLMNRCLKVNKNNIDQILFFENLANETRRIPTDQLTSEEREELYNLDRQIASLKGSQESLNRDYRELQTKKNAMLKEMKATREQRVKHIEDSKHSFTGWVTYIASNPEIAKSYGIEMEKMRLAMDKERTRLSAYHKYSDGEIDIPFLTPEVVLENQNAELHN